MEKNLEIGTWVYVSSIRVPDYRSFGRSFGINDWWCRERYILKDKLREPKWGQITGLRRVCEGMRTNHGEDGVDFKTTKVHTFYEVRFGMLNKPVLVGDGDFLPEGALVFSESNVVREIRTLPTIIASKQIWNERSKSAMRKIMKDWPRDDKGKWIRQQTG